MCCKNSLHAQEQLFKIKALPDCKKINGFVSGHSFSGVPKTHQLLSSRDWPLLGNLTRAINNRASHVCPNCLSLVILNNRPLLAVKQAMNNLKFVILRHARLT